jgi:hypothetical protein
MRVEGPAVLFPHAWSLLSEMNLLGRTIGEMRSRSVWGVIPPWRTPCSSPILCHSVTR